MSEVSGSSGLGMGWTIDDVLAKRAITTVFQPIVHLGSRSVIGFEALTRGPTGTELESPQELLGAAAVAGRTAELDWLCRAAAMHAALEADLHPSLSWFINAESAGLATPCPEDLLPLIGEASSELRVVIEIVERGIGERLPEVLLVESQIRRNLWGIAVDDVGVNAASLALLPVIRPDVIKINMSVIDKDDLQAVAYVVDTVNAYVEHSKAVIVAEGVETEEQERLARIFGATYAQGYRFGGPGPLPESVVPPREVIPLLQQGERADERSLFQVVADVVESRQATRAELEHVSRYLQSEAQSPAQPGLVLASFRDARHISEDEWARLREIIETNVLTIIAAHGVEESSAGNVEITSLPPGNRMANEWAVIVLRSRYTAAFAARSRTGPDDDKGTFDFVVTHDPVLVADAARLFLRRIRPELSFTWLAGSSPDSDETDEDEATPAVSESAKQPGLFRRALRRGAV